MTNVRRVALLGGIAYLVTFVSIAALPLLEPVTDHSHYVFGAGADNKVILGGMFELITALGGIASALALYPVTRRVNKTLALGFVASRTVEAGLICVGVVSILSVVTLRQDLGGSADAPAGLLAVSQALVDVRQWTFMFGPGVMPAINALFLATMLYKSGLVPRILPLLGLIGAPLLIIKTVAVSFGAFDDMTATALVFALPIAVWEFGLGLYLTFKGFRPTAVRELDAATG